MAHPNQNDMVKLFDGSITKDRAATAYVLKNCDGQAIGAGAFNLDGVTISVTEVIGLRKGLSLQSPTVFKKWWWRVIRSFH